jgi:uncharacterized protein (DUF1800 family)
MNRGKPQGLGLFAAFLFLSLMVTTAASQADPDPNSPTPVILTATTSPRALAAGGPSRSIKEASRTKESAFDAGSAVTLFAANIRLREGEGSDAFRVYAVDGNGRAFRLPVTAIVPIIPRGHFAVTVELRDELRFFDSLTSGGDVMIYLTWRGLKSNDALLGIGSTGGRVSLPVGTKPVPYGSVVALAESAFEPDYVGYRWSGDRKRFLEQATFGPTSTLDNYIRRIGIRSWLAQQFEMPYPSAENPYPNQPLKPGNAPADCDNEQTIVPDVPATCFRDTYTQYQPQTWFFREAFYGDAQLRHRVAWAMAQIWVTSGADIQQGRHMVEYHKVLSKHAFGNYRALMKEMTLHPTMGEYLDMARSTRNNPNENYARELKQLFSIGLFMLNQNGTYQTPNGEPVPTYTQAEVDDLTKVLTGWGFCNVLASCPNIASGAVNFIDPLILNGGVTTTAGNRHDLSAKTLLSYPGSTPTMNIPACTNCAVTPAATALANIRTYADASFEQAIDNIFLHPNVGPYIGKILIQHLVTSDPTPQYVSDVAAAFNNNGQGVRGDMKAVIRTILLHPEARGDIKTDPNFGKLREPVLFATNFARHFGVRSASGTSTSDGFLTGRAEFTGMAQIPFLAPTVFNFYPPDFVVPGSGILGPEFALMTTGTTIQRANFVNRMVFTAPPIPVANPNAPNGTGFDFSDLQAISASDSTGNALVDELDRRLMHSTMSAQMKETIRTAVTSISATDTLGRVRQAIYLVATSSQFQIQR